MKRLWLLLLFPLLFTGCGLGVYSVSSGKSDCAKITFVDKTSYAISVKIDGVAYENRAIKVKPYQVGLKNKKIVKHAIEVSAGRHHIEVVSQEGTIYSHYIFISSNEHKIIEL